MKKELSLRSTTGWIGVAAPILALIVLQVAWTLAASAKPGLPEFSPVTFETEDGGTISGSLFRASGPLAVVLAHGAVFNKESWYPLARKLRTQGVTSLPIDFRGYGTSRSGRTGPTGRSLDILGAVHFLKAKGFKEIGLVGGSMGGAAVLSALARSDDPAVVKALLLAPAGGPPIKEARIEKLFIVSREDRLHPRVAKIFEATAEPKKLDVLPGSAHAQNIFSTPEGAKLTDLILRFLTGPTRGVARDR
ncbi:MAG TPA: alpha/beta fold hydrolase [Thermoanaerobaculia bacterium]|nr:alpha/beta fold hydrolase [Thermoanaerobaculia bacterium]